MAYIEFETLPPTSAVPHQPAVLQPGLKATPIDSMDSLDVANLTDGESVFRLYSGASDTIIDQGNGLVQYVDHPKISPPLNPEAPITWCRQRHMVAH